MSDAPDDPDLLAAEYVLGVLPADDAARCAALRRSDPAFAARIAAWERRLAPLAALAPAVAPPPYLLARIEDAMALRPGPVRDTAVRERRELWFWRGLAGAGLAATCVLAVLLWLRAPVETVAVLLPPNGEGAFLVRRDGGEVQLRPARPPSLPPGRDMQLWVLPAGAGAPRSLGVLPSGGTSLPAGTLPGGDAQLLVSVEPAGGSPTGQPTGPVILGTQLPDGR